jgi:hypothetical protein
MWSAPQMRHCSVALALPSFVDLCVIVPLIVTGIAAIALFSFRLLFTAIDFVYTLTQSRPQATSLRGL